MHRLRCAVECRVVEFDRQLHAETIVRQELHPLVALHHFHRLFHPDELLRLGLLLDASRLQQKDERCGRAIHDGNLCRRYIDNHVIDAQPCKSGHQMLDRADTHAGVCHQRRGEARVVHERRLYRHLDRRGQVGAAKDDTGIGRSRVQGEFHPLAGVQTNAGCADRLFQRALQDHEYVQDRLTAAMVSQGFSHPD